MSQRSKKKARPEKAAAIPLRAAGLNDRWMVTGVCIFLATIVWAVFGQTMHDEFVNYDDGVYVYENPEVARGLKFQGIAWAFTHFGANNWHPLTWLSHMLDCQFYGLNPGGHHLTNVLLHTTTAIVLFLVLRQMTGFLWRSAFVAAVFAIHPLRVESVAWVAERKDVLSGLFFMLTLGAYVRYARRPWSPGRYGLVLFLFAMGLMCKPMLVTLPFVLLLLDYWPLQRVEPATRLVMEKLPLLALAAASCVVTILAQQEAIQSTGSYPPALRFENASVSSIVYLGQMVWPAGLAVFYPYPHNGLPAWAVIAAPILLLFISAGVFILRKTRPYLLVGWLWYLVMLAPVIGIVQAGLQSHADRYTYLPQIGIYVAAAWLVAEWSAKRPAARTAVVYLAAGVLAVLMACAWKQTTYWQNSESLWNHTLDCTVDNVNAHLNLGNALLQKGSANEAIAQYQQALQIEPDYAQVYYNLGNAFLQKGSVDDAITQYQEALRFDPGYAQADNNLGYSLLQKGSVDDAIAHYQKALQIDPDYAEAHNNLGYALLQKSSVDDAIVQFQKALELQPDYAQARNNLGNAFLRMGKVDEANIQFKEALQTQSPIHQ